jgi:hypothetical protein
MSRLDLLLTQMDDVYERLSERLRGLSDAEYFWDPTGELLDRSPGPVGAVGH